jgi:hypothetical protein
MDLPSSNLCGSFRPDFTFPLENNPDPRESTATRGFALINSCYQRKGSSRKQVDSHFGCMAVCWRMANIGVAPALAPNRIVLGPLSTQGGFQYWYLACFPDCVVALRQGIGAFFVLGMANDDGVS